MLDIPQIEGYSVDGERARQNELQKGTVNLQRPLP